MKSLAVAFVLAAAAPEYVATYQSAPNVTLDEFVHSFSREASVKSEALDAEICGELRRSGDSYSIDLYTTREPDACRYVRRRDNGHIGQGFHTHLKGQPLNFSKEDLANPGYMACGKTLLHQNGPGTIRRVPKPIAHGN